MLVGNIKVDDICNVILFSKAYFPKMKHIISLLPQLLNYLLGHKML